MSAPVLCKLPGYQKNLNSVPVEGSAWGMGDLITTGLLRETRQDGRALLDKRLRLVLTHFSSPCVFRTFVSPTQLQTKSLALAADEVSAGLPADVFR